MGLLDKIKNVFFEEEIVEVEEKEVEPREKVTVAKKIETPEIRKKEEIKEEPSRMIIEEEPVVEEKPKFPMSFDDKDFEVEKTIELEEPVRETRETRLERELLMKEREPETEPVVIEEPTIEIKEEKYEVKYEEKYVEPVKEVKEEPYHHALYEGKENKEQKGFTPSPIISPIYGILNKNYKKEEIVTKKEIRLSQVSNKKADLDLVREKAYGDLAGDISASIEDDLLDDGQELKEEKEDLLYDLNESDSPVVKTVTVGDAEEYFNDLGLEYNVDYKVEEVEKPKEEVKEAPKSVKKMNVEDTSDEDKNLFDLIDSMYEDKE
jgi:hypothetical protein